MLRVIYIGYCDGASFGQIMMMGLMNGMLFSRSIDVHVDNVCASVVVCQSSVGHEVLCTDMLLKAY